MSDKKDKADKKSAPIDIAELMENAFMMGIGVMELGREKSGDITKDLIDRGKMSQSEAKRVADRLTEMAEEQQEAASERVAEQTEKAIEAAGVATKDDVESLKAEIAELKALLAQHAGVAEDTEPAAE